MSFQDRGGHILSAYFFFLLAGRASPSQQLREPRALSVHAHMETEDAQSKPDVSKRNNRRGPNRNEWFAKLCISNYAQHLLNTN